MNPKDVFPRRNLPGDAEVWGREVEERIQDLEYGVLGQGTNLKSDGRANAANFQELARQVFQLRDNQTRLDAAIRAVPKPAQSLDSAANFALGGGWNTVVSTSITVPAGVNYVRLAAYGSGQVVSTTTTQNVETQYRVVVPGIGEQPPAPGPWAVGYGDFRTILLPSYAWNASVTPGQVLTAQFQVQPTDPGAYSTPNGNSYAIITLRATFTG